MDPERRRHRRLPLRLPLVVSGENESGPFAEKSTSVDVSAGGVYFRTPFWKRMPVGSRVHVAIQIASETAAVTGSHHLRTVGRVVRVAEPKAGDAFGSAERGVAVEFERALQFAS